MMEQQLWTQRINRKLPKRFRDELPYPPQPIPDVQQVGLTTSSHTLETSEPARSLSMLWHAFTTVKNVFGLFHQYHSTCALTYEPDDQLTIDDLSNIPLPHEFPTEVPFGFYPYPNQSAFTLGDWFWNGGINKSKESFDSQIDIIGDPIFNIDDVWNVNWDHVNKGLGIEDVGEWLNEDAGWTSTPVSISVPFQPWHGVPSPENAHARSYTVGDFHHWKLVSVIKEKITCLEMSHQFHFEPYELLWHPSHLPKPVRVQGELYSSPAFIDVHRDLQNSLGEPGCNLPQVVVALMYFSNSTHLTTFGNAKLWSLYQHFGNDSKYLRCKPTSNLCEHIAYFLTVCVFSLTFYHLPNDVI